MDNRTSFMCRPTMAPPGFHCTSLSTYVRSTPQHCLLLIYLFIYSDILMSEINLVSALVSIRSTNLYRFSFNYLSVCLLQWQSTSSHDNDVSALPCEIFGYLLTQRPTEFFASSFTLTLFHFVFIPEVNISYQINQIKFICDKYATNRRNET